jgi:tRNA uridine 5-carbamoylmethylation protein Kti12
MAFLFTLADESAGINMETDSNRDLQLAYDFVRFTNRNIFLTGKAGTGKTTFLKELKKSSPKRMIVLAPTGVAAINAGGVTIHSFFQLPLHPYIPSIYLSGTPGRTSEQKEMSGYRMSREKINIIRSLDLLVIDEISMVRADILDAIDAALRRYKNHYLPFGGVQLLMIGDLQQLAPVVKDEDIAMLGDYYKVFYFFGSKALASTDYVTIELKHIYRQTDQIFINLLNKVRESRIDSDVLNELNKRYVPDFDSDSNGGYITLTTHNYQAQAINDSKLQKLPGRIHSFKADIKDDFPELAYPNVQELILRTGAQVMFVKNDISKDKLYFNGKIGKVVSFDDDIIVVKCPGDDFTISVEPVEWQNVKYTLDEETKDIQETVIGTFTQYPLRLAWAITIHKSQGLTFDRVVIDARAAFAHGQVYVALSRCRTLDGLVLNSRISHQSIIDDPFVTGFVKEKEQNQPGEKELAESKKTFQQALLNELFSFAVLSRTLSYCIKVISEHHESILGSPGEKLEHALAFISSDIAEVADRFLIQVNRLSEAQTDAESNDVLQDRIKKAAAFFSDKIETLMGGILKGFSINTDNKAVKKSVNDSYERFRKETGIKMACLAATRNGFRVSEYLDAKSKSFIEVSTAKAHATKAEEEDSGANLHPVLFKRLKEWRNEKSSELNLPHYMILHQKTMLLLANKLPQSIDSLKQVKGIGKKKTEKFGEELLEIILSYCSEEKIDIPDEPIQEDTHKKVKLDTKKISFDLFREGKTVQEISEERQLGISTIESHLAHFVGTGEISINQFVPQDIIELISAHFDGSEDFRIGPLKAALGEKVTWSELRFVMNHLRFLRSK